MHAWLELKAINAIDILWLWPTHLSISHKINAFDFHYNAQQISKDLPRIHQVEDDCYTIYLNFNIIIFYHFPLKLQPKPKHEGYNNNFNINSKSKTTFFFLIESSIKWDILHFKIFRQTWNTINLKDYYKLLLFM